MLRLYFLGEQRVRDQGAAETSPPVVGRALELLAYLVVNAGRPQERERLAGLLWPESGGQQSRTNLRRELHGLRHRPGLGANIRADGTALSWQDGPGCRADVRDFAVERTAALRLEREGDPAGLLRHGWAAIEAYAGDLLPGLYDDWVLAEREALHRQCVDLCDRVAAAADVAGDPVRAVAAARRRIQLEPLEEAGYQTLIGLQAALGDTAAAVRTYHRCASVLEQELGVAPGPRTRQLARSLLGFTPALRPAGGRAVMVLEPGPGAGRPVGREREESMLRARWTRATAGAPGLVLVTGDAGVGKTRLVVSLFAAARAQRAVTAYARCFAGSGGIALAPVAGWLGGTDFQAVAGSRNSSWSGEVGRLLPSIPDGPEAAAMPRADAAPQGVSGGLADAWQRLRFFEGMAQAVLAPGRPTLLVLDDLQWCDEESLNWLSFLFDHAPGAPLLIAATARTDDLAANTGTLAALNVLRNAGWVSELALAPLDSSSSAELAESVIGRRLTPQEIPLLHAATGGYPLYIVEAARGMGEAGLAEVLLGTLDGHGVLRRRLEQCSQPARDVAALAAAVGRVFNLDLLAQAWDADERSLVQAVDELWRRRILREQRGGYDFSHDLLRQAAYDQVSPPQHWLLHRRLAQGLEALHPGNVDAVAAQLADQYRRSGAPERALHYYLRAGDAATRIFANARALADYQSGLDILDGQPPGRETAESELDVRVRMPAPLTALQGYSSPQLRRTLVRIVELSGELGHPRILVSGLIGLFAATFVHGETALSHSIAARALGLAKDMPDLAGQAHFAFAGAATSLGRTDEAIDHFDRVAALSPDTYSYILGTRVEVHARAWSAHAHWLAGDDDGALALAAEAEDRATRAGHPYSLAVALAYGAVLHQLRLGSGLGGGTEAEALARSADQLRQLCGRYDFAYYGQWGAILQGWLAGGEPGLAAVRTGISELRSVGAFARMPYWLALLADTLLRCGRPGSARAVLAAAEAAAYQRDDLWWLPEVLRLRARLEDPQGAASLLARARTLAREQHSPMLAARLAAVGRAP